MRPQIPPELAARTPPGQHLTRRWPVLHYGDVPTFDPDRWNFEVVGLVEHELRLSWADFAALPAIDVQGDMHCVTRWSMLDNSWRGVAPRELLQRAGVKAEASFVIVHCEGDYSANLPLSALDENDVVLATHHDGERLSPEHGLPVRLVVPSRYAWKSAKWVTSIEIVDEDRPGFWETFGYNSSADPWREERFAGDES